MARYLTIEDGREYLWDFDENRILLVTYGDTENIRQVEFSTDDTDGPTTWTSEVMTNLTTGNKYVQVPNEFLSGEYSRLVCYVIAEDETGQHTRTKEIFRIKKRQQPEDYEITFTDRVYIRDLKAIAERYRDQAKSYSESASASSTQAGQYNAQALESKNAAAESERNAESSMESALSAQHGAESARNDANAILTLVQSKGTEITNFVTTSKTELETQKNESLAEVRSVYTADLDELKGDYVKVRDAVLADVSDVYKSIVNVSEAGRLGNSDPVITINIPTGTPYKFKLIDNIGAFTNYTLYENQSDNTRASVGYYAVNTEISLIAGRDIAYLSIYPSSVHQASGNIIAQVSIDKYNKDSLQVQVEDINKKAEAFNIYYSDVNLIDASKALLNKYIGAGGQVVSASNLYATDFCEISDDKPFYVQYAYNGYYAYYNENKECIQYYGLNQGEISDPQDITELTPPSGAKYVRFSIYYTRINDAWLNDINTHPTGAWNIDGQIGSHCDYSGNDMCVFSKGLCIGDSLTEGTYNYNEGGTVQYGTFKNGAVLHDYSYPKKLSQMLGIDITNYGIGGQTSAEWWNLMKTVDFSGHDFAIIQLGVNDVSRYGTWGSTSETAYTNIINKLKADNPNIKIYVATIIPSTVYTGTAYDNFSESIRTFVAGLNDENVILADIAQYGHTGDSNSFNAGHLSAYGYWRLAQDYKNLIGYLICTNQMQYRQVQFIGTTHSFS